PLPRSTLFPYTTLFRSISAPLLTPVSRNQEQPSPPLPFLELPYFNGTGGFTRDGREYAIYLKPEEMTPAPWINVMANAGFGTMVDRKSTRLNSSHRTIS